MNEKSVSLKDCLLIKNQQGKFFIFILIVLMALSSIVLSQQINKIRVIVLFDIEADPDDTQSLIRFVTYSNHWDVEGLKATTYIIKNAG